MEEAPENGKESSHAHANGMNEDSLPFGTLLTGQKDIESICS
jgi:hypothetical protein